jgi:hypothetical protein
MLDMRIKICPEYVGLCNSCRYGLLAKTASGDVIVRCDWFDWKGNEPIVACSKYDDRRLPSLRDMRQTAWILKTKADKTAIGFVSNEQWRKSREFQHDFILSDDE